MTAREMTRVAARFSAATAGSCTTLECLPVCPTHGEQMILQTPGTAEQEYCGTWYRCPQCANTVLYQSKELLRFLAAQTE